MSTTTIRIDRTKIEALGLDYEWALETIVDGLRGEVERFTYYKNSDHVGINVRNEDLLDAVKALKADGFF
jgi:hypothetical protein